MSAWVFIFLFISSLVFVVVFGSAFLASLLFEPNKKCSRCAEWIPRKALKCSHCGSEQPQPIPRAVPACQKVLFVVFSRIPGNCGQRFMVDGFSARIGNAIALLDLTRQSRRIASDHGRGRDQLRLCGRQFDELLVQHRPRLPLPSRWR